MKHWLEDSALNIYRAMPTKYRLVDDDFKSKHSTEGVDENEKQAHKKAP
ncbi:hypothetical protein [Nitrosomonas communis]